MADGACDEERIFEEENALAEMRTEEARLAENPDWHEAYFYHLRHCRVDLDKGRPPTKGCEFCEFDLAPKVQPLLRGRIEGPLDFESGREARVRSLALTARAIGIAMEPDTEGWPKGVLPQRDRDALVKAADLVLKDLWHPGDKPLVEKEGARHEDLGREAADLPPAAPKMIHCPSCRGWHREPACG